MDPSIPIILRMRRGAGWFLTIALLSAVNSVLQIFDAKIRFIFGLGITQVKDVTQAVVNSLRAQAAPAPSKS